MTSAPHAPAKSLSISVSPSQPKRFDKYRARPEEGLEVAFSPRPDVRDDDADADDDDDDCSMGLDALAPYPAYRRSSVEIQDCKELQLSLGENWSIKLAGELSSCDMSVDGTIESDVDEYDDDDDQEEDFVTDEDDNDPHTAPTEVEDDETRRKRNLLWKQSLKASMFTKCR